MLIKKVLLIVCSLALISVAGAYPIKIVAAENFYGELAKEIGGDAVQVQSIINNPNEDPHLFTISPATTKALNDAQIVIYNGVSYDPWMAQILRSLKKKNIIIINVANLMHVKANANPHIWYMPNTFPVLATTLAEKIILLNPGSKNKVKSNLSTFLVGHQLVMKQIDAVRLLYVGTPVTATEPVFEYMTMAMGLNMLGLDFQWKIMNDTEPSPKMLAQYEELLIKKKVKVLFYNSQVTDSVTGNILELAKQNKIVVVGVTETMPVGVTINQWLANEINATRVAIKASK